MPQLYDPQLDLRSRAARCMPGCHEDPPPAAPPADMSSRALQLRAPSLPVTKSSCSLQMQASAFCDPQQQQFGDLMLPSNDYGLSSRGAMDYNSLPPLPTSSPLPWSHAISSDVDYYDQGMAACSLSESLTLYTPLDSNSYSPQDSFSSSSSSCYDSPTRMESSFHGFLSKRYPYQYCSPHQDNVAGCWPAQLESAPLDEYAPYHLPTDYPYIQPVEESYFRKDFPLGSEISQFQRGGSVEQDLGEDVGLDRSVQAWRETEERSASQKIQKLLVIKLRW
ncbi:hypothetical protein CCH79_00018774 [Gambusia affinis]|uniref:Uncharacterized protein n=1 Tax=Gambusia affinis TaxID=33528 RepID=A0A315W9F5_GAMAF|nr:hypothetical protein CCH79_00018774 [Gambusia affinis]